jgi:hypothetical protein
MSPFRKKLADCTKTLRNLGVFTSERMTSSGIDVDYEAKRVTLAEMEGGRLRLLGLLSPPVATAIREHAEASRQYQSWHVSETAHAEQQLMARLA